MKTAFPLSAVLLTATAALAAPAPDPVPKPITDMLRIAVDSGDPALAARMVTMAKTSDPTDAVAIDALYARLMASAEKRRRDKLLKLRLYQGWKGKVELGAYDTRGVDSSTGVTSGISFVRDGLRWKQEFTASVDYLHQGGVEVQDRYFAGHQANYKFNDRLYALGLVSWEGNRVQGFNSRASASLGLGLTVIKAPHMSLSVELSPAVRSSDYIEGGNVTTFAGRGAGSFHWDITPRVTISEDATYYRESDDLTLTSESAATIKLIGALSMRLSYRLQKESRTLPVPALESNDGTSRVALVYTF